MSNKKEKEEDELTMLQAKICKVLSHPKRLQIVYALREGERYVGELAQHLELPYANLSQHLRALHAAGIVEVRHAGKYSYYRLTTPQIAEACEVVRQALRQSLERLGWMAYANHLKEGR
ncbi:MAG: metalloregulator ArsR/SmtB family transcription factor [Candidatus Bipolaricaulota bacterium]|nr:metalloregulator ArsR/SmtB family transcription factor [Candidatus Bipolaricaulota bacterium]MDW8110578.1 metalloregulator ArsR/SmtB family transcription factor [Candidatus Bipolaricaulota bacterium]MDW8329510.1 metalloregulator ArsR/SmtB family transcription factor [Candidatus Bipolaricaulota bacterium]